MSATERPAADSQGVGAARADVATEGAVGDERTEPVDKHRVDDERTEPVDEGRLGGEALASGVAPAVGVAIGLVVLATAGAGHGWSRWLALGLLIVAVLGILLALRTWDRSRALATGLRAGRDAALQAARDDATARADAESRREGAEAELAELREHAEHERAERDRAERELRQRADSEHEHGQRLQRAREAEREWNRELRSQLLRLHRDHGVLGDPSDLPELVLKMALTLLGAEKGLLISRPDHDTDGRLHTMCSAGFDHDPSHSALVDRFAGEVIERDTTVRENRASQLPESDQSNADGEIENLVAIPIYLRDDFAGVVVCANREQGFEEYDDEVLLALGDHAAAVLQNGQLHGELRSSYLATVRVLAEAIEAKDPFLRGHSDEVSDYVAAVARRLDLDPARREQLVFGSLLHDVGKIGISERILLKPGALSPEERTVVQLHPRIGYRIVSQVPALASISPAILHHHERFDGGGYPTGLRGEQIPLEARIVCVADSFSAMTAERPYRRRVSLEEACVELERCAGTQFDPEIVRIFVEEVRRRPPSGEQLDAAREALHDPEVEIQRTGDEPVLGSGSFAVTDNLTLLYTHRYFHEVAAAEAERSALQGGGFGVVLARLSTIAEINRAGGYAAGDDAIRAAGHAVQRAAVRHGATACRYSGRMLGLLVPGMSEDGATLLAAELADDMVQGPPLSLGVAAWRVGEHGDDTIARARLGLAAAPRLT